jgi:hypothetical protein
MDPEAGMNRRGASTRRRTLLSVTLQRDRQAGRLTDRAQPRHQAASATSATTECETYHAPGSSAATRAASPSRADRYAWRGKNTRPTAPRTIRPGQGGSARRGRSAPLRHDRCRAASTRLATSPSSPTLPAGCSAHATVAPTCPRLNRPARIRL